MKILVAAHGTRGDMQPGFSIAHSLAEAGHDVTVCAPAGFETWTAKRFSFVPVGIDLRSRMTTPTVLTLMHGGSPWKFARLTEQIELEDDIAFQDVLIGASEGMDLIIAHPLLLERAAAVAEYRRLRMLPYCPLPFWRTRQFSSPVLGGRPLGALTLASHWLFHKLAWRSQGVLMQRWRKRLGLSSANELWLTRMQREGIPSLETYSTTLCPKPDDWGEARLMTGMLRPPVQLRDAMGERALAPELSAWLEQGPPPIFITFGSQPLLGRPGLIDALRGVLAARKLRAVFDMGWSPIADAANGDDVMWVRGVNHAALLPRCAAALHHGGAGSTATTVEAGIPSIVCAAMLDQPFWARRIEALGIGRYVPYRQLNAKSFAAALDAVLPLSERARQTATLMKAEDGYSRLPVLVSSAGNGSS